MSTKKQKAPVSKPQNSQSKKPAASQKTSEKPKVSKPIDPNEKVSKNNKENPGIVKIKSQNLNFEADYNDFEEERKDSAHFPVSSVENSVSLLERNNKKPEKAVKIPISQGLGGNFNEKPLNFNEKTNEKSEKMIKPAISTEKTPTNETPVNFIDKTSNSPMNFAEKPIEKPPIFFEKPMNFPEKPQNRLQDRLSPKSQFSPLHNPLNPDNFSQQTAEFKRKPEVLISENLPILISHMENKAFQSGLYDSLDKRQIQQKLTEKIFILTDELEKLSKIASQNLEDNKFWKLKYAKLKELYLKNVDEDLNPEIYFEGLEYSLDLKPLEKKDLEVKLANLKLEREKAGKLLKSCQDNIKEFKEKIEGYQRNNKEKGLKARELETGFQNKIKVLQNELEILRTEQNNKNKGFKEEKYEKLLKSFLELKEEKDQMEREFQMKVIEIDPNETNGNLTSIPTEGVENTAEKIGALVKNEESKKKNAGFAKKKTDKMGKK